MLLIEIDKARYRRHLNMLIAICIISLFIGSFGISQTLIYLYPSPEGTHFHWNLLGVVSSVLLISSVFNLFKEHDFLNEVRYVWRLKKQLNLISRKMRKLLQAAKMGDKNAMLALQYSYTGSRQLWLLDDNTITLSRLDKSQQELDELLQKYQVNLDLSHYEASLLTHF